MIEPEISSLVLILCFGCHPYLGCMAVMIMVQVFAFRIEKTQTIESSPTPRLETQYLRNRLLCNATGKSVPLNLQVVDSFPWLLHQSSKLRIFVKHLDTPLLIVQYGNVQHLLRSTPSYVQSLWQFWTGMNQNQLFFKKKKREKKLVCSYSFFFIIIIITLVFVNDLL